MKKPQSSKKRQANNKKALNKKRRDKKRTENKHIKLKQKKNQVVSQQKKFNNYLNALLANPDMPVDEQPK